jgi:hypothetical protein
LEPVPHPALRQRWQSLGLLGLLSDEELALRGAELPRRVVLEGAPSRAGAWRALGEVYAMLIERSVDHEHCRAADENGPPSGDLRPGVVAASAGAGDHRLASG